MSARAQSEWHRVKEIFSLTSETPAEDRTVVICKLCEGDHELRHEVEELLALREEDRLALDRPAPILRPPLGLVPRYQVGDLLAERYRITAFVASGGMGEVYAAVDVETDHRVALKCIRNVGDLDGQAEARLIREVRMAGEIEHSNVCRIFGLEYSGADRFCVMELLEGQTLAERLTLEGRYSAGDALPVVRQILDGLDAAHRAGVLHRDLKPANIMLSGERAVIIDFGLAAAAPGNLDTSQSLTATGALIGTLAYVAPEQLNGAKTTLASDLYSLGVIIYEMLTGAKPHEAKSPFQLAAQKANETHLTPAFKAYDLPPVWREAITCCLKAKPEERLQSAAELRALLDRGRASLGYQFTRWRRRLLFPTTAVLAALLAWGGWAWAQNDRVPPSEAARLYAEAQSAMNGQAPMRATKLLERAVEIDSRFVKARSTLAAAYADLDQPEKARDAVLKATAAADDRWILGRGERRALNASRARVMRNYTHDAALYQLLADVTAGPERGYALVARARALEETGQLAPARQAFDLALKQDPRNAAARVGYALLLCRERQYDQAAREFAIAESALTTAGNLEGLADLLLARATALRSQDPQGEQRDLERVLDLSAKTGNSYHAISAQFRVAAVAERARDYDRAVFIAREAARQATHEGMPVVAAQAMGELGYAFLFQKKNEQAEPLLREAVELATRAASPSTLAGNQLKLGEVLSTNHKSSEAVAVMEPAVRWYRQHGSAETLPLRLIKWGTALGATPRFDESTDIFLEALDLATHQGNELYQATALQRLSAFYASRDLRLAVRYAERTIELARKSGSTGPLFQSAGLLGYAGQYNRAAAWIREGEEDLAHYPDGIDRRHLTEYAKVIRAWVLYGQGRCDNALRILAAVPASSTTASSNLVRPLARACASGATLAVIRQRLTAVENQIAVAQVDDDAFIARSEAAAGAIAVALQDWSTAQRHAERGLATSTKLRLTAFELENLLVMRAAAHGLGNHAEAARFSTEVLATAAKYGFSPPQRFGERQDLLRLWRSASSQSNKP